MHRSFHYLLVALVIAATTSSVFGQFRASGKDREFNNWKPAIDVIRDTNGGSLIFSDFDQNRWPDLSSYSFTYIRFAAGSTGLAMYTNTLQYVADDDVRMSTGASAIYSPFGSFGYSKSLNGISLSEVCPNWKIADSSSFVGQYFGGPGPNSSPFYFLHDHASSRYRGAWLR